MIINKNIDDLRSLDARCRSFFCALMGWSPIIVDSTSDRMRRILTHRFARGVATASGVQ